MRHIIYILLTGLLVSGCATPSTVESRKQERLSAFNTLPADQQQLALAGQIRTGMTEDAVYVAVGRPDQILQSQTANGPLQTTWIYMGEFVQEVQYLRRRSLARDYYPQSYVSTQVIFVDGKVNSWRTLPRPVN